jgi:uncharacterized FlgJ-related protein
MKNLFYFLLGISLIVLTSATTVSVMTVKPEKPKQTLVEVWEDEYLITSPADFIKEKQKKGWILKQIFGYPKDKYKADFIVIMEKY